MGKKGGGSQLSQLKGRLHSDGITDRRQMKASAKKRKRGQAGSEKDEMMARREKLSKIASSSTFNPFEERVTKPKNAVLGRRIKGAVGTPGMAKMGGLKERTERLLPEYRNRNKSGSFVDRRFGENGADNLTVEEKMLERFTRERQGRAGRTSLYNLDDAEEEGLTHYGKSLNDLDDYDDIHLSDEEEGLHEEGTHFGGFDEDEQDNGDGEERKKSKAEVMKEVMAKSKLAKYERQQTRLADDDLREELDNELGDLRSLLMQQPAAISTGQAESANEKRPLFGDGSRKDAYDSAVRELAFERRAKPQDRLKTEEEKAEELAERLKKAEKDRLRRMRGEEVSDDETSKRNRRKGGGGGDDLEDDFELDGMTSRDVYGLGQGLATQQDEDEDEESDDSNDIEEDDSDEESGDDEEDEDEEDDFGDLADLDELAKPGEDYEDGSADSDEKTEVGIVAPITKTSQKPKAKAATAVEPVLPFTFPCPVNHDELIDILDSNEVAPSQVPLVIKRIRALYHPSLAEDNKFKLQAFLGVLLDHVVFTASRLKTQDKEATIHLIEAIIPQIFSLSKEYPAVAVEHFVNKLALMQRNLIRGLNKGPLLADSRTWPAQAECILLKVASTIWPTSDRIHPVTTPLSILVSQYLSSCRVRSISDLASGLFLCCLTYDNERQSKRIVPEALNFLHNSVTLLAPVQSTKTLRSINQAYGIPWPDYGLAETARLRITSKVACPGEKISFDLLTANTEDGDTEEIKAGVLSSSFSLVSDFAILYTGSTAFIEIFQPFRRMLENLATLPPKLEEQRGTLSEQLLRLLSNAKSERRFLRLQAHRAIAIASHVPKFDQGFNPERRGGRTFDPDTERAEQAKLRALLKKERKGAIRELRRDNDFLANEKRREREEEDQRYKKTMDRIVGSLSAERSEQKKYLQEKDRLKRRSGKK